jgi:hypothetical protein
LGALSIWFDRTGLSGKDQLPVLGPPKAVLAAFVLDDQLAPFPQQLPAQYPFSRGARRGVSPLISFRFG